MYYRKLCHGWGRLELGEARLKAPCCHSAASDQGELLGTLFVSSLLRWIKDEETPPQ